MKMITQKGNGLISIVICALIAVIVMNCKKQSKIDQSELAGHFLIYHVGEQDKSVSPFLVKINGDTTYQRITRHSNGKDPEHFDFNRFNLGYRDMEDCNAAIFSKFRNIIREYNKNNKIEPNYEYGTFKIDLMDNVDTLVFTMHKSEYTASFFEELKQIADENGLENAGNRFGVYKYMQTE